LIDFVSTISVTICKLATYFIGLMAKSRKEIAADIRPRDKSMIEMLLFLSKPQVILLANSITVFIILSKHPN